jgi:hypothetical protein
MAANAGFLYLEKFRNPSVTWEQIMAATEDFSVITTLDLEPIKHELLRWEAGNGWTPARAASVEREYRRFLYLAKAFPDPPIAPVVEVDEFWHYHILNTKKYAADCQLIFGYFLHHFPYAGMRGKDDEEALAQAGERTRAAYEEAFGEPYLSNLS